MCGGVKFLLFTECLCSCTACVLFRTLGIAGVLFPCVIKVLHHLHTGQQLLHAKLQCLAWLDWTSWRTTHHTVGLMQIGKVSSGVKLLQNTYSLAGSEEVVIRTQAVNWTGIISVAECLPLDWKIGCSIQSHWVKRCSATWTRAFTSTDMTKSFIQVSAYLQLSLNKSVTLHGIQKKNPSRLSF